MKSNFLKILALAVFGVILTFTSCKDKDPDTQSSKDAAKGAYVVTDIFALGRGNYNKTDDLCLVYKKLENGFSLNFDGCDNPEGIVRKGTVIVEIKEGSTISEGYGFKVTFDNYSVDGDAISGSLSFDIKAINLSIVYNLIADNLVITENGVTTKWSSRANHKVGFTEFIVNGEGSGVNADGEAYVTTSEELFFKYACDNGYPVKGTMTVSKNGDDPTTIDFDEDGAAACNTMAKLTKKGHSIVVDLSKK